MQKTQLLEDFKNGIVYPELCKHVESLVSNVDDFILFLNSKNIKFNTKTKAFYTVYKRNMPVKTILNMHSLGIIEIGDAVSKISGKPFKNGKHIEIVTAITINKQDPKRRVALQFSNGSICNMCLCTKVNIFDAFLTKCKKTYNYYMLNIVKKIKTFCDNIIEENINFEH